MVRHFLLAVATRRRREGNWTARQRRRIRRPANPHAADWHVGFAPGPHDNPEAAPRRKPDYCLNIGITCPGLVALEIDQRVPNLSFKSFGAFTEGAARRAELVGDIKQARHRNGWRVWKGDDRSW